MNIFPECCQTSQIMTHFWEWDFWGAQKLSASSSSTRLVFTDTVVVILLFLRPLWIWGEGDWQRSKLKCYKAYHSYQNPAIKK